MAKLKIYIDENVDIRVAEGLRRRGIKAYSAVERKMIGATDIQQFNYALTIKASIFTHDHHFIEIANSIKEKGRKHWGVIFSEMHRLSIGECIKKLSLYTEILSAEDMINRIEFL